MKYIYRFIYLLCFPFIVSCQSGTPSPVTEEIAVVPPTTTPTIQTSTPAPVPTPSYTPLSPPPTRLIRLGATPTNTPKISPTPTPTQNVMSLNLAMENQEELIVLVGRNEQTTSIGVITSNNQHTLYLTDSAGNELSPKWSPDGKYIAYVSDRQIPLNEHNRQNYDLWLFDLSKEQSTRLTRGGQLSSYVPNFAWSPDSNKIIYYGPLGVSIVDLHDLSTSTLGEHFYFLFAWSVNDEIALSDIYIHHPAVHSIAILDSDYIPVLPPKEGFKVGGHYSLNTATTLTWHPDGERLAIGSYFALRGSSDLRIVSIMDNEVVMQASLAEKFGDKERRFDFSFSPPSEITDVVWSPDGSMLAFHFIQENTEQIYVTNDELTELLALTSEDMRCNKPQWSSDSIRLVFACLGEGEESSDIWMVHKDGTELRQLTNTPVYEGEPVWQPKS